MLKESRQKNEDYFESAQCLYNQIRKIEKEKFAECVTNCDLFLLFDCLKKNFDEHFAMLVLVMIDKNIKQVWNSLEISQFTINSKFTINKKYMESISKLNKLLPNMKILLKLNNEVKFSLPLEKILDIIRKKKKIEIPEKKFEQILGKPLKRLFQTLINKPKTYKIP